MQLRVKFVSTIKKNKNKKRGLSEFDQNIKIFTGGFEYFYNCWSPTKTSIFYTE